MRPTAAMHVPVCCRRPIANTSPLQSSSHACSMHDKHSKPTTPHKCQFKHNFLLSSEYSVGSARGSGTSSWRACSVAAVPRLRADRTPRPSSAPAPHSANTIHMNSSHLCAPVQPFIPHLPGRRHRSCRACPPPSGKA